MWGPHFEPHLCNAASTFPAEKHKRHGDQIDNGGRKERKSLNCELMPNYKFPLIVTRRRVRLPHCATSRPCQPKFLREKKNYIMIRL